MFSKPTRLFIKTKLEDFQTKRNPMLFMQKKKKRLISLLQEDFYETIVLVDAGKLAFHFTTDYFVRPYVRPPDDDG